MAYNPLLTKEIVDRLDEYIEEHLPHDPDAVLSISVRDRRVQCLYPQGWPLKRIGRSLGLYMDLRRDRWDIEYHRRSGRYNLSTVRAHKKDSNKKDSTKIEWTDFDVVRACLDEMTYDGIPVTVSIRRLEKMGARFKTRRAYRNIILQTYLSLHTEYVVDHVHTNRNGDYEVVYRVARTPACPIHPREVVSC